MRIKIVVNKQKELDDQGTKLVSINELDGIPDSSSESFECETLDYIRYGERQKFLHQLITKVRVGGELFIRCLEYDAVYRSIQKGLIGLKEFNELIYGGGRVSIDTLKTIIKQLEGPINITGIGYNKETCWIKGVKC